MVAFDIGLTPVTRVDNFATSFPPVKSPIGRNLIMVLVFDTETTGLPKRYDAPINEISNWPRVIQLAWALYDKDQNLIEQKVDLIKPNGWKIPDEPFWVENGFSQEKSEEEGIPIRDALIEFLKRIEVSTYLIAHNLSFDYPVLGAECIRENLRSQNRPQHICTKEKSTDFCQLPGNYGYKWPTLSELHIKLFDENFEGAHDALADVKACSKCFFKLKEMGIITL